MTTQEIYTKAISLINQTITLGANVTNGCTSDYPAYKANMERMESLKTWAIANDKIQDVRHFLASKNFGSSRFSAQEISTIFNN